MLCGRCFHIADVRDTSLLRGDVDPASCFHGNTSQAAQPGGSHWGTSLSGFHGEPEPGVPLVPGRTEERSRGTRDAQPRAPAPAPPRASAEGFLDSETQTRILRQLMNSWAVCAPCRAWRVLDTLSPVRLQESREGAPTCQPGEDHRARHLPTRRPGRPRLRGLEAVRCPGGDSHSRRCGPTSARAGGPQRAAVHHRGSPETEPWDAYVDRGRFTLRKSPP